MLLWHLKQAHRTSRWGHNSTIAPASLWCNYSSETASIHRPCSQPLNNCDCGRDDCKCCECRHTDTTAAVITLTVAVLVLVATAAAIVTMVSVAITTSVVWLHAHSAAAVIVDSTAEVAVLAVSKLVETKICSDKTKTATLPFGLQLRHEDCCDYYGLDWSSVWIQLLWL